MEKDKKCFSVLEWQALVAVNCFECFSIPINNNFKYYKFTTEQP